MNVTAHPKLYLREGPKDKHGYTTWAVDENNNPPVNGTLARIVDYLYFKEVWKDVDGIAWTRILDVYPIEEKINSLMRKISSPVLSAVDRLVRTPEERELVVQINEAGKRIHDAEAEFRGFQEKHHTVVIDDDDHFDYTGGPLEPEDILGPVDIETYNSLHKVWDEAEGRLTTLRRGIPAARATRGVIAGIAGRLLLD